MQNGFLKIIILQQKNESKIMGETLRQIMNHSLRGSTLNENPLVEKEKRLKNILNEMNSYSRYSEKYEDLKRRAKILAHNIRIDKGEPFQIK